MTVQPGGIVGGSGAATVSSLGSAFGLSDDEYNTYVKIGDNYTPHMETRQVPVMTEVDLPDGSKKMVPTNQMQNAQEDYIDRASGQVKSRDVRYANGTDRNPIPSTIGAEVEKYSHLAYSSNKADQQKFKELQDKLYRAGFTNGKPSSGMPDTTTINGLVDALKTASRGQVTLDEVLDKASQTDNHKKAARSLTITTPTDINAAIGKAAPALLGHGVDQATIDKIQQGFNSLELNQQNASADASEMAANGQDNPVTGSPTTLAYNPPDLTNYVSEQLRAADPAAAQGQLLGNFFAEFQHLMHGGGQ